MKYAIATEINWPLFQNSLWVAGMTTALAVCFGLLTALWLATLEARWRNVLLALAVVALALPPFLVTNCWLDLLGDNGVLRSWLPFRIYSLGGTIWILSLMLWPITVFAVLSAWQRLEAAHLEADPAVAGWALLRGLLLPVARGELMLSAVLTFVLALNNFAVPAILQTKVLPDELWVQFNTTFFQTQEGKFDFSAMAGLTWPLVIAPAILLACASRPNVQWPRVQGTVAARIFRRQLGTSWHIGCGTVALILSTLSVALPLAQIALANRTWVELTAAVAAGTGAVWNSFWFAALAATVVIAAALVVAVGHFQRRGAESAGGRRGKNLLRVSSASFASLHSSLVWLPFFVPGVLLGIALIHSFNNQVLAAFYQSAGIVVLAFGVRYFAIGWTATRHAIGSVDSDLTDAAKLEGATRWQLLRLVLWPQIAPQLAAAWYIIYLLCLWDVESMILVYPPGGETLALRIFNLLHYGHNAQVNALCLTLLGLAVAPWLIWRAAAWARKRTANLEGSTQHQLSSTREKPGSKLQIPSVAAFPGVWCLKILWCLVLGAWCFCSACTPSASKNESALPSKLFESAQVIGTRGTGVGQFNKPRSVAVDKRDNLYVVDMTGRVQKFSPDGTFMLSWQLPQTDLGKPKGMSCDREGNIIVIEPHYQRVNHFSPDGKLVAQWGTRGTNDGRFTLPRSVAVNSRGEILVSEYTGAERVQKFTLRNDGQGQSATSEKNGPLTPALSLAAGERENALPATATFLASFGRPGTGQGEFNRPEGLGIGPEDRIYVADSCNHRIQVFSSDGKWLRSYGRAGSGKGELSYPYDIRVDSAGMQFVCEFGNSRVQIFDAQDQPVEIVGGSGGAPGRFSNPWAIALDSHGNLYAADAGNHRVQKFIRKHSTARSQRPEFESVETGEKPRLAFHARDSR